MLNARFSFALLLAQASAFAAGTALVYDGPGSCPEDCTKAAALMAERAGLTPILVKPSETNPEIFRGAALWVQPGGQSGVAYRAMVPELRERIVKFVRDGGSYAGFCAGGFLTGRYLRDGVMVGFDMLKGSVHLYEQVKDNPIMLDLQWNGQTRHVYWEGGPYFDLKDATTGRDNPDVQVVATYPNGAAATVRFMHGAGRVSVTGLHPEAPEWWRTDSKLTDRDGLDYDLADEMIAWSLDRKN